MDLPNPMSKTGTNEEKCAHKEERRSASPPCFLALQAVPPLGLGSVQRALPEFALSDELIPSKKHRCTMAAARDGELDGCEP